VCETVNVAGSASRPYVQDEAVYMEDDEIIYCECYPSGDGFEGQPPDIEGYSSDISTDHFTVEFISSCLLSLALCLRQRPNG